MFASQLRAIARESLAGKWGKAALITLFYVIITLVINFVLGFIPFIGGIVSTIISLPISYGIIVTFMKLKRGENVEYTDFLSYGFSNFGRVWGVFGNIVLKMILPLCLIIIFIIMMIVGLSGSIFSIFTLYSTNALAGFGIVGIIGTIGYFISIIYAIVKGYLYSLSYMLLNDNENMSGKEIVEKSAELMNGHRARLFCLGFSFIGWIILSLFTFGIGFLWVMPYIMIATICFYENRAGLLDSPSNAEVVSNNKSEE